jgi:UDP-glucose 4-epimerase
MLGDGARLRLFCRNPGALAPGLRGNPAVEIVAGDALDPRAVADSLRDVDLVIDCVGATLPAIRPGDLLPEVERSLAPLAILLDAMARRPGRRLIFPSSGGAIYGSGRSEALTEESPTAPEAAYGLGKLLAEEMIRFRGRRGEVGHLILRASNVYGRSRPRLQPQGVCDIFLDRAARGEAIELWGDGSQIRDYLFIDDFVQAVRALLLSSASDEVVHVSTGVGSSLHDVVAAVESAVGPLARAGPGARGYPGVDRSVLSSQKLRALTGWSPRFSLASGIAEAARRRARDLA